MIFSVRMFIIRIESFRFGATIFYQLYSCQTYTMWNMDVHKICIIYEVFDNKIATAKLTYHHHSTHEQGLNDILYSKASV